MKLMVSKTMEAISFATKKLESKEENLISNSFLVL
jgi:hypothetical protein